MPRRAPKRRSKKRDRTSRQYGFKRLRVGDTYIVVVEDCAANGDGIARVKDTAVFIPGAKIGEVVKIRIKTVKYRKAQGVLLERKGSLYDY
ncbi:MAG: TRAM domain-containing protein [archaeon GB-1867-005]|nr:TRAM domain-containing protein [Candidatus Culexmicrobium cathedralense]